MNHTLVNKDQMWRQFALFPSWVMFEYQPIQEDAKIVKRAIFDLVTFRSGHTIYVYSNSGYAVLSSILEKVRGRSFHDLIVQNL